VDEELAGLIEAQRAFEAAARLMSVVDEALDVLINRTGMVGR
jgi:flagellar hook-associated protein 1 FlgK